MSANVVIQFRRGTAAEWSAANPTLASGEIGYETDTYKLKAGDGSTAWNDLSYVSTMEAGILNDISDVVITSAANGDFLRWDGSKWINDAVNLSTDTIGEYVAILDAGTNVTITNNSGEGATPTITVDGALTDITSIATPNYIYFNTSVSESPGTAGQIGWNSDDGTLDLGLDTGGILKLGQEMVYHVHNSTASTIYAGQSVGYAGTHGSSGKILIEPFVADATNPSKKFLGVVTSDIEADQVGYVAFFGTVRGVKTNYSGWSAGDILYADPSSSSSTLGLINVQPSAPNNIIAVAVIQSVGNNGNIFVRPTFGSNLGDDEAVILTSPQNKDSLFYNSSTGVWENSPINLGQDTVGSYVSILEAGTGVTIINNSGESATPNIAIGQDVSTTADVTFGTATINGLTTVGGSIIPDADVSYDLGSATYSFRDIYLSGTTINLGGGSISFDGTKFSLEIANPPWTQLGADIDGEAAGDNSGYSVSLSDDGTVVAIGARRNDENGYDAGHVRVYEWNSTSWVQRGSDIDGEAAYDYSGTSVSLSADGSVLAIGSPNNDGNGNNAGRVRVYAWNGTSWVQRGANIDGEAIDDWSGTSVSLSSDGSIVAIAAPKNDAAGTSSGHVRVFEWDGTSWVQKGSDIDGEAADDSLGESVSLSADGSIVAIGVIPWGNEPGHVRVFEWDGTSWVQKGSDIDGEAGYDYSGYSVSLSDDGTVVAIGAPYNDGNGMSAGHVRVYEWDGSAWVQKGSDIDGEAAYDQSGYSVSLSADGSIVAVGADVNDGNGDKAGHVRVYEWDGTSWVQKGSDIDGEAAGDQSGYSVSLSSDGSIVAVGAIYNDGTGSNAGHVRVYSIVSSASGSLTGDLTGNADTATSLETARTIQISGDVAGSATFDGTADINISATIQADSVALGTDTTGDYTEGITGGTGVTVTGGTGEGNTPSIAIGQAVETTSDVIFNTVTSDLTGDVTGNADTATSLETARTISLSGDVVGSVSFDGTSNVDITATIQADSVALGTDTTGDYVSSLVAGTGISLANNSGESATPTVSVDTNEIATKSYVDSIAAGIHWHEAVDIATAAALPNSPSYDNGTSGVGSTLSATTNGRLVVDGVNATNGDRVLVQDQSSQAHNGIYTVSDQGSATTTWELTRATDADGNIDTVNAGDAVFVLSGTNNNNQGFIITSEGTGTGEVHVIGTDSIVYTQFTGTNTLTAGNNLVKSGNTISVDTTMTGLSSVTSTNFTGDIAGDVTGNVSGNVTGNLTGDVTGNVTGDINSSGDSFFSGNLNLTGANVTNAEFDLTGDIYSQDATPIQIVDSLNKTFTGDLTGNVDGDVTGNLNGDVYSDEATPVKIVDHINKTFNGNFTGNVIGDVTGDLTGDVTGNINSSGTSTFSGTVDLSEASVSGATFNLTGDVTGDVTGNVTGGVTGNVTGDVTGDLTGDVTGNINSSGTSTFSGTVDLSEASVSGATFNLQGDLTGDVTGNVTGDVTGNVTGDLTGDVTGNVTGNVSGNVTGDLLGDVTGNVNGNVTGDLTGSVTGDVYGNVTGNLNGDVNGDVTGSVTGNVTGDILSNDATPVTVVDHVNKTFTGDLTGDVSGNLTGNVTGNITSTGASSFSGSINLSGASVNNASFNLTGNVTGDLTGDVTGNVTGDLDGNVSGNVTGNLTGDIYSSNGTSKVLESGTDGSDATFTGNVTGNLTGNVTGNVTGDITGDVTGNADTSSAWATSRQIALTGDVTGDVLIDGSANVSITTTISPNSVDLGADTTGSYVSILEAGTGITLANNSGESATPNISIGQDVGTTADVTFNTVTADLTGDVTGNSDTASAWATARTITLGGDLNGSVSIDGSANVILTATVTADSVALGTDTTGDYIESITAGTGVTVTSGTGEGAATTVAIGQSVETSATPNFNGATLGNMQFGITSANEIDTTSDGLTLDSSSGETTIDDNLTVTGTLDVTGAAVFSSTIQAGGDIDANSNKITNLSAPTQSTDAATKGYVDAVSEGLHVHEQVHAITTTSLATITGDTVTYDNGTDGVGATLTLSTALDFAGGDIDGDTDITTGDRVLIAGESTSAHNGVYVVTSTTVLTRADDFDTPTEMAGGDFVFVTHGSSYADTGWVLSEPVTTVGTSDVTFIQFSGAGAFTAGTGLTLTGTEFSVNASQTQITGVGTLTSGTWEASVIDSTYGGTGVNNGGRTITVNTGNLTIEAATPNSSVTFPASGTMATIAGTETLTNKTLTSPIVNTPELTLSTTTSSTDGRIAWDATEDKIVVGNGTDEIEFSSSLVKFNQQATTSYTLVLSDKDKMVEMHHTSANTLTIPPESSVNFPIGTQIMVLQTNAGQTTIAAGAGVSVHATPGLKLRDQYAMATMIKRGSDTWIVTGDLSA